MNTCGAKSIEFDEIFYYQNLEILSNFDDISVDQYYQSMYECIVILSKYVICIDTMCDMKEI